MDTGPITVSVRYYNVFLKATGKSQETVELAAGSRVRDLTRTLAGRYGGAVAQHLAEADGKLPHYLRVFRNGQPLAFDPADVVLHDGDELVILMAASGG